jgi:hypothetical protein
VRELRVAPAQLERESRPEGEPDDIGTTEAELLQERVKASGIICDPEPIGRFGRSAAAGRVPGRDGEVLRESIELVPPLAGVRQASMEEDDGRAGSSQLVGDRQPCDLNLLSQVATRVSAPSSESRMSRSSWAVPTKIGVSRSV